MQTHTFEETLEKSLEWCVNNVGWKRICDIEDIDSFYTTWEDLSTRTKNQWTREYGEEAQDAWLSLGDKQCKVPYGYVTGSGEFFTQVPMHDNFMTVLKIN